MNLRDEILELIEFIRDTGSDHGGWILPEPVNRFFEDEIRIGLARFQSYRARTTHALVDELEDFVEFTGAGRLYYHTEDDVVILTNGT